MNIAQAQGCSCGRQVISMSGACGLCIREGSDAFWLLMEGRLSPAGFYRRLRRTGGRA